MVKSQMLALVLVLTFVSGCQIQSKRNSGASSDTETETTVTTTEETTTTETSAPPKAELPQKLPTKAHVEHHRKAGPVSWDKALGWLKNGNKRFLKGQLRKDGQNKKDITRLSKGQKPHSIVLSCSDSRVPPELTFDQKLGEIFVVRTAGQALDSATIGSIEYAVEHLGSNLIVVMGHTSCGAVKAAHMTLDGTDAGSPHINNLLHDIHPRLQSMAGKEPSAEYMKESWANVKGVAKDLYNRSAIIRNAMQTGELKVAEALYDLESGVVTFH